MENFPFNITVMPRKKTWINNSKIHIFTGALFVKKGTTPKMVLINVEKNVGFIVQGMSDIQLFHSVFLTILSPFPGKMKYFLS